MKKKKLLAGVIATALLAISLPAYAAYEPPMFTKGTPVTIHVDGEYLPSDVDPIVENGRTMIPLRAAGEAVGATVDWDQATKTASATLNGQTVTFTLNSKTYYINGTAHTTDVAPKMLNNRTLLPIRPFAEGLDLSVNWNQALLDVDIDTDGTPTKVPYSTFNDPDAKDALNYLRKYYVEPTSADPFIGTWKRTEGNKTYYIFIEKVGETSSATTYSYFELNVWNDGYSVPTVILFRENASKQKSAPNTFVRTNDRRMTYFRGPGMGFTSRGSATYITEFGGWTNDKLICKSITNTFGDPQTTYPNDVYTRVLAD